jgi:transcriptional regulator with XRE-family HTH domain
MVTPLTHPWSSRRKELGLTQAALGKELFVSRHMVIRLEQSLFAEPPPGLLNRLGLVFDEDCTELLREYHSYVRLTRRLFATKNQSFKVVFGGLEGYEGLTPYLQEQHPLEFYRETQSLSRIGFCKGLCLHQDPINDYEKNRQRDLPAQLYEACSFIGWNIEPLTLAVKDWRIRWH